MVISYQSDWFSPRTDLREFYIIFVTYDLQLHGGCIYRGEKISAHENQSFKNLPYGQEVTITEWKINLKTYER